MSMFTNIANKAIGFGNKIITKASPYAPTIAVAVGVIGTVAGAALACKATLDAEKILDEHNADMKMIHDAVATGNEEYTDKKRKNDTLKVYSATAGKFLKLYGPALAVEAVSVTAILTGFGVMKARHGAAVAAIASIDRNFSDYRGKVKALIGEQAERALLNPAGDGVKTLDISKKTVDEETGEVKEEHETVTFDESNSNMFTYVYDCRCANWAELDKQWLFAINNFDTIKQRMTLELQAGRVDHFFIKDVLKRIGFSDQNNRNGYREIRGSANFYGYLAKPGASVDFDVIPYYEEFGGEDDEQFPMEVYVDLNDPDSGSYQRFFDLYETNPDRIGFVIQFDRYIEHDENGVPRQIYTDVYGNNGE